MISNQLADTNSLPVDWVKSNHDSTKTVNMPKSKEMRTAKCESDEENTKQPNTQRELLKNENPEHVLPAKR